jgi:hypothetical protein
MLKSSLILNIGPAIPPPTKVRASAVVATFMMGKLKQFKEEK